MFFKSDRIEELEKLMNRNLELVAKFSHEGKTKEVEYFKSEYKRLSAIHAEEMQDWLSVW